MKRIVTHIIGILLLITFISCNDSETVEQGISTDEKRISVAFSTVIPLPELPSSRGITDDSAIDSYVIWVFSDGYFKEAIYPDDTQNGEQKVDLQGSNLHVLLPDGMQKVTLVMIANVVNIKEQEPAIDTSLENANATFTGANASYMPMCGTTAQPFNVSYGANGGEIVLLRAMAKVEVKATGASDHFELQEMHVYRTNPSGQVKEVSTITNIEIGMTDYITGNVDETNNSAFVYLPEVKIEKENDKAKTFVLVKGKLNNLGDRWFKLDFIGQEESSDEIKYYYLDELKRNHRYVFDIQYLTEGVSYESLEDAIAADASNKVEAGSTKLIVIQDEYIMDITTNNYIYLGVTAGNISTTEGDSYHVANVSIITNSDKGWKFESLPEGVSVSISEYSGRNTAEVVSVWVYLDKTKYQRGSSVTIYVYGNNIRKSITVTVP